MAKIRAERPALERATPSSGLGEIYFLLTAVVIFWGGNFVAAKIVVPFVPPFTIATARFALATICLLLILRFSRQPQQPFRLADLPLIVILGATGYTINTGLFYMGMRVASASEGAVIVAVNPAITALLAALLLHERLTLAKVGGLVLAFAGVFVVATAIDGFSVPPDHVAADLTLICMATSWAFFSVLGKFAMRRYSPLAATTYAAVAGTALLIPISLFEGGWGSLFAAPIGAKMAIIYMAIFASVITMIVWYRGIERIGASRTSLFNNAVPVVAMLFGALFLHESITPWHIVGLVLVTAGIFLANKPARHK